MSGSRPAHPTVLSSTKSPPEKSQQSMFISDTPGRLADLIRLNLAPLTPCSMRAVWNALPSAWLSKRYSSSRTHEGSVPLGSLYSSPYLLFFVPVPLDFKSTPSCIISNGWCNAYSAFNFTEHSSTYIILFDPLNNPRRLESSPACQQDSRLFKW